MRITATAAMLCLMVLISLPVNALTYAMYKKYNARPNTNLWAMQNVHIKGIFSGITAANVSLEENHQRPLFCIPGSLILEDDNIARIIDTRIKKDIAAGANETHILIEIELLLGLQDTFPCK